MRWDDLFADLEAEAAQWRELERDAEVADRLVAERGRTTLVDRLWASLGASVRVRVAGVGHLGGRVSRVGPDWVLFRPEGVVGDPVAGGWAVDEPVAAAGSAEWSGVVVALGAVTGVTGLAATRSPAGTTGAPSRDLVAERFRLTLVLRRLAGAADRVVVHRTDASTVVGLVAGVGADFVEVAPEADSEWSRPAVETVPLWSLAAVRAPAPGPG